MPVRPLAPTWLRRCVVAGALALVPLLLTAAPASARVDDGERSAPALSTLESLALFVGAPLAIVAVVTVLTLLPSGLRRPRYRPVRGWEHEPLWFGGPEQPDVALAEARPADGLGGARGRW